MYNRLVVISLFSSSKGKSEFGPDEPVAFFATEEDWYVGLEISVQCTLLDTTYQSMYGKIST